MHTSFILATLAWVCVLLVLYYSLSRILIARHNSARARELECKDPIVQTNKLPFGIDQILRSLQADKQGGVLNLTAQPLSRSGYLDFPGFCSRHIDHLHLGRKEHTSHPSYSV